MQHLDDDFTYREKDWRQLHNDSTSFIKQILEATSLKIVALRLPTNHLADHRK